MSPHLPFAGAPARAAAVTDSTAPVVILGGGLAGGLTALALCEAGRGAGVTLIERDTRLGGNHTWSFHDTDLDAEQRRLVMPLVAHRWPRHLVQFPGRQRIIETGYATFTGEDLARVVSDRMQAARGRVLLGVAVASLDGTTVRLTDGRVLRADLVLDARGAEPLPPGARAGYQKFVGLEVELREDGPWTTPVVMDATVSQLGGYRFVYVLPFTRRHVLIEDTVYGSDATLDVAETESRVWAYVQESGAAIQRIERREIGVLPLPITAAASDDPAAGAPNVVSIGYRGGFFHPVTGYSLPLAARVATAVARTRRTEDVPAAVAAIARDLRGQQRFGRLLNRLLFQAMPPGARWHALDRFYRLPDATIARFYASRNTLWDRLRVLAGRPPRGVSLIRMMRPRGEEA